MTKSSNRMQAYDAFIHFHEEYCWSVNPFLWYCQASQLQNKQKKPLGYISAVRTEEYPVFKEASHCLSLTDILCSILWNLYNYYKQFSECVETRITELRQPIEKELKVKENFAQAIWLYNIGTVEQLFEFVCNSSVGHGNPFYTSRFLCQEDIFEAKS